MTDSVMTTAPVLPHGTCADASPADGFHPGCPYLVDYALGRLKAGQALAVATHLALCPRCRGSVAKIESAAGVLLETVPPKPVSSMCLKGLLAKMAGCPGDGAKASQSAKLSTEADAILPAVLLRQAGCAARRLAWKPVMKGVDQIRLRLGHGGERVRLLRLHPDAVLPVHSHSGAELTVVLSGGFSDDRGRYVRGDFVASAENHHHQPQVTGDEPCICLAVTQGPVRPDSLWYRVCNFFIRF